MIICPLCQQTLKQDEISYRCENGHSFDVGKAGDVNLLLANQKRSKQPGDSKAMVTARRDFLAGQFYQPIAERLANLIIRLSQGEAKVIADAGCGEGYYLRQIQKLCYPNLPLFYRHSGALVGWDISKFAVQSAAKQADFSATWITASNAAIPLTDDSVDILLSNFGFEVPQEFSRVVKSAGYVVTLDSGENHLRQMREIIYEQLKPFQEKSYLPSEQFRLLKSEEVSYDVALNNQQLQQLILMTPHLFRANVSGKQALQNYAELSLTVNVILRVYQVL